MITRDVLASQIRNYLQHRITHSALVDCRARDDGPQPRQIPCDTSDAIIDSMAQLIVRNLDEEIVTRLRQRAAKHRRSTEAEHREILREVLLPPRSRSSLKEHLLAMPDAGTDRDFERPPDRPRKRVKL